MFLVKDFKGFTTYEKVFFGLFMLVQVAILVYFRIVDGTTDWLNVVASVTLVLCLIMSAKGRLSTFVYGLISVSLYGWISYQHGLYGEVGLQVVFIVFQFLGFATWVKNRHSDHITDDPEVMDVDTKGLDSKGWISTAIFTVILYAAISTVLTMIHAKQPYLDSLNVSLNIIGQTLMTFRFKEQWFFWMAVNVVSISLWVRSMMLNGEVDATSVTMAVMWLASLINSVYGYYNWKKLQNIHVVS